MNLDIGYSVLVIGYSKILKLIAMPSKPTELCSSFSSMKFFLKIPSQSKLQRTGIAPDAVSDGVSVRNGPAGRPFFPQRFPVGLSAQA